MFLDTALKRLLEMTGFGIMIGGVPVVDDSYVCSCMGAKAGEVVSKIDKVSCMLRTLHLQAAHCVTYYCLNSLFHHWVQHCYPEQSVGAAGLLDEAVLRAAKACLGNDFLFGVSDSLLECIVVGFAALWM